MLLDAVWIGVAFLSGLAARQIRLPPLVGYLVAGFVPGVELSQPTYRSMIRR